MIPMTSSPVIRPSVTTGTDVISLADVKAHLKRTDSDEDSLISRYISAAVSQIETHTKRVLFTQAGCKQHFSRFDTKLILDTAPVASVATVTYYDSDNQQQTLSTDQYFKYLEHDLPEIHLDSDYSWPDTYDRPDAITVTFTAGWEQANIPAELIQAVLLLVGKMEHKREDTVQRLPTAVEMLIDPWRLRRF